MTSIRDGRGARDRHARGLGESGAWGCLVASALLLMACTAPPTAGEDRAVEVASPPQAATSRTSEVFETDDRGSEPRICAIDETREEAASLRSSIPSAEAAEPEAIQAWLGRADSLLAALPEAPITDETFDVMLHVGRSLEQLGSDAAIGRAAALYREVEQLGLQHSNDRARSFALGFLGGIEAAAGEPARALKLTRQALFLAADAGAPESLYRWHWQLGRLQREAGEDADALASLRRAVATVLPLRAQSLALRDGFEEAIAPVFRAYVDLLLEQAAGEARAPEREAALREARDTLESFKAAELRDYFRDECLESQPEVSPDDIPGAVVIYPVILQDRTELLVSFDGSLSSTRVDVDAATLTAHVNALRVHLESRGTFRFRRYARDLYDWLIRPLEPQLAMVAPGATLVFVPGGVLRTIPMAALLDRETSQFLIERYPIAITPGMRLTDPQTIPRERASLLAVGVSEAQLGFPALHHVPDELAHLEEIYPGVELLDDDFSALAFREQLAGRAFDLVHIASHGSFSGDTRKSFILAHEGKIGMTEIADAIAATRFRERSVELLTLSACESAAGDERAALGLAGIAVRAGARSAVASLWSVHDEAASILMQNLYASLRQPGVSRGVALQRAQLTLLRDTPYRHPAYWAPFLLINNWL